MAVENIENVFFIISYRSLFISIGRKKVTGKIIVFRATAMATTMGIVRIRSGLLTICLQLAARSGDLVYFLRHIMSFQCSPLALHASTRA